MQSKALQKPIRESGIELLRILMMLQVIFLHVCSSTSRRIYRLGRGRRLGDGTLLLIGQCFIAPAVPCMFTLF